MKFRVVLWNNYELLQVIGILCLLRRIETVHSKYETASGLVEFVDLRVPKIEERTFLSILNVITADASVI